jgi:DNA polymerase I-like protein with 3'-5' exonuclease and polymerase domains
MLDSEWTRSVRSESVCENCPAKDGNCLLSGYYAGSSDTNFIVMLESPDFRGRGNGTVISHEIRNTLKTAMERINSQTPGLRINYSLMYACASQEFARAKPTTKATRSCAPYMNAKLAEAARRARAHNPHGRNVILALGPGCAEALQLEGGKHADIRGRVHTIKVEGHTYAVVPTISPRQMFMNPNTVEVLISDLGLAMKCLYEGFAGASDLGELTKDYVVPKDIQDVRDLTEHVLNYTGRAAAPPENWAISIDTETTGVHPYAPDFKVLMLCVGWDEGKAATIVMDHKMSPYDPVEARECVRKIVTSRKPKIMHNAKFDINVLQQVNIPTVNLYWDTLLGYHWINEGATGFNGLKSLTLEFAPTFAGYEDHLKKVFIESINDQNYICYEGAETLCKQRPELRALFMQERRDVGIVVNQTIFDIEAHYCALTLKIEAKKVYSKETLAHLRAERSVAKKAISSIYKALKLPVPKAATVEQTPEFAAEGGNYEMIPLDILSQYGGIDADITRRIAKLQMERVARPDGSGPLAAYKSVMKNQYIPGTLTLERMERRGTLLDKDLLEKYRAEITVLRDNMEQRLRTLICDSEVNLKSGAQLGKVIAARFNLPARLIDYNEDGSIKIDAGFRQKLKRENSRELGELAYCLSLYGQANKALSTYLAGLERAAALDGRVHTRFNLNGTVTGRLSSADPNLQNIPSTLCAGKWTFVGEDGLEILIESSPGWKIKCLFIPDTAPNIIRLADDVDLLPEDRMVMFNLDIASAEVRVLCAFLPKDDPLAIAVRDGMNVPSFMTSKIFGLDYDYVEKVKDSDYEVAFKRTACKRVLYGLLYGQGTLGSVEQIYGFVSEDEAEKSEQVAFAKSIETMLFDMSPGTKAYIQDTHAEVNRYGQVWSLFGRVRRFPLISVDNSARARAQRQAVNFKIQTAASDLLLSQMCELDSHLRKLGGELLLTVHDSIAGQVPLRSLDKLKAFFDYWIVERIRERYKWMPVDYQYEVSVGPNYGSQIPLECALTPETVTDNKYIKALVSMGLREAA